VVDGWGQLASGRCSRPVACRKHRRALSAFSAFVSTARGVWRQQQVHLSLQSRAPTPLITNGTYPEDFDVLVQPSCLPDKYQQAAQEQYPQSSSMPGEVSTWMDSRSSSSNVLVASSVCLVLPDVPAQTTAQYGVPTKKNCSPVEAAVLTQAFAQGAHVKEATEGKLERYKSLVTPIPVRIHDTLNAHDMYWHWWDP
jgi:hypothetical protein